MHASENPPIRLALLISGGGRTALNLQEKILAGTLNAKIVKVIASRPDAPGIQKARDLNLDTVVVDRRKLSAADFDRLIEQNIAGADLVCMAGFLSMWNIPASWLGRVINIHPALLPEFGGKGMYGLKVHRAVLAAGKKESGCTVHFCDNVYDNGPIILQRRVPVLLDDTPESLAARVFEQECIAYPEAIELVLRTILSRRDE